ncbi:MAG TPA: hypothetical protein EYH54_02955 [Nautiliaceae bacterium]|nr:hypothetical protein [Nautiliaceae bacterium]
MRYFVFVILLLFIIGCSVKKPEIGKKVIPNEDEYIIKALFYEDKNLSKVIDIYKFLYKETKKEIYFKKLIENLFFMKRYKKIIVLTKELKPFNINKEIFKYRIFSLIELNKFKEAKKELLEKFNKKDEFFYKMMSYFYLKEKKYNIAVEYLKSLYAIDHNKNTLLELADILIKLKKYNEALAYLRTHLDLYGCEYDICIRLAIIYRQLYDYKNLALIYEKLAKFDKKYLFFALRIYLDNKAYDKALKLIHKYNLSDEFKLVVYEEKKDYKKASFLAKKLYEESAKLGFLLKYCIYAYKVAPSKKTALNIIPKLKYLLKFYAHSAFVYNFLGYILIDNDIDVKEGIKYIKKALEFDPNNEEYLDSLAWGYYKLGKCKKAWEIIKNIKLNNKEIKKHKEAIKKCKGDK